MDCLEEGTEGCLTLVGSVGTGDSNGMQWKK
jgi:hypothetical protein